MTKPQHASDEALVVIHSAKDEMEASAIVNTLEDAGIQATMQGQHTGSFRAENWTDVLVVVREADANTAREVISQRRQSNVEIDWDQVDVGKPID